MVRHCCWIRAGRLSVAFPPRLYKLEVSAGVEQYPLTGPCFQRLNGLGGENLKDYRNVTAVKYGWRIKMWIDAG